jgi:hypothetical protein
LLATVCSQARSRDPARECAVAAAAAPCHTRYLVFVSLHRYVPRRDPGMFPGTIPGSRPGVRGCWQRCVPRHDPGIPPGSARLLATTASQACFSGRKLIITACLQRTAASTSDTRVMSPFAANLNWCAQAYNSQLVTQIHSIVTQDICVVLDLDNIASTCNKFVYLCCIGW